MSCQHATITSQQQKIARTLNHHHIKIITSSSTRTIKNIRRRRLRRFRYLGTLVYLCFSEPKFLHSIHSFLVGCSFCIVIRHDEEIQSTNVNKNDVVIIIIPLIIYLYYHHVRDFYCFRIICK